jgi:uncharacterized protein (DUF488 family)
MVVPVAVHSSIFATRMEVKVELFPEFAEKRAANARKFAAFGITVSTTDSGLIRTVRKGSGVTIYTVGYERRDGESLIAALRDHGIRAVADVRERPTSRKPDFRSANLTALCRGAGIEYRPWPMLGSTVDQREELHASGDFRNFGDRFRRHALQVMTADLAQLAEWSRRTPTALLCYERLHKDCHRSVIADLVAERLNATIIAIQ